MSNRHAYGWKPSLVDHNDRAAELDGLRVLMEVDPRADLPAVYDQGALGSCTANAIAAALQYDEQLTIDAATAVPSRLFIYYCERVLEGTVNTDAGAWGRDGFKVLRKTGAPPESMWPYDIQRFTEKPDEECYLAGNTRRIKWYVHPGLGMDMLARVEAFKRLLSNRQTIAFGFSVYESFENEAAWDGPLMPLPVEGESLLGGHEVLLVGYIKEYPDHALVRNSWGEGWGEGGYFLMPWKFLADPRYSADWRSIYREAGK